MLLVGSGIAAAYRPPLAPPPDGDGPVTGSSKPAVCSLEDPPVPTGSGRWGRDGYFFINRRSGSS